MNMRSYAKYAVGIALASLLGCAPSVGTVDRTQPNALDKSQFEGIWYHRAMVTEADPEAMGNVEGITSNMEKIRWDITQELLVAYRSYEFVPYAEGLTDEGRDFFGAPVAAYRILSHFDIQREYSATTGVETNVIVENTTDRPWHERGYIRVDWSTNIVDTRTPFFMGFANYPDGYFSGISNTAYYVQGHEETNPDRPWFTEDYFDITNRYSIDPSPYYCSVMLLWNSVPRCGSANVKVRLSFRKVDPADDYESLYYPDVTELKDNEGNALVLNFDGRPCGDSYDPADCEIQTYPYDAAFGNFRMLRIAYDRERLLTRTGRLYVAGRFNIWKDSFAEDGSLIPPANREPKPVIYYGNVHFPVDIMSGAQKMADHWAEPFEDVVAFHKGWMGTDGRPDRSAVQAALGARMFQFRRNDCSAENIVEYARANNLLDVVERVAGSSDRVVMGNVEQVCAAVQFAELQAGKTLDPKAAARDGLGLAFSWQRKGDLRYNFQNYIQQVQNGPWGVAQFGQDPETGEFLANIANYFGDAGDIISQREVDIIQWLNGDLNEEELFRGDFARDTVTRRRGAKNTNIRQAVKQMLMNHEEQLLEEAGDTLFGETSPGEEEARFQRMFAGTDVEREVLVTEEVLRGFAGPSLYQPFGAGAPGTGARPDVSLLDLVPGQVSEAAMEAASPVNFGITPQTNDFMKLALELGSKAVDLAAFFDPNSSGLADFYKGFDRDEIWNRLRVDLYESVQGHEVGHTVGLRHNFRSSMDAQNYRPEFWHVPNGENPPIEYWKDGPTPGFPHRGNEYKYASIMDYGFDIPLEGFHGIGAYDQAAIRFMYGQLQEVWDPAKVAIPDPRKYGTFARRCGHDSDFWGVPALLYWMGPENIPRVLSTAAKDQSGCAGDYDRNESCDTPVDQLYRELVARTEANANRLNLPTSCPLFIADINWLLGQIKDLPTNSENVFAARKMVKVGDLIDQRIAVLTDAPEYDDVNTPFDESDDRLDSDGDGVVDDKGYDWSRYQYTVDYGYCSDIYASYSSPWCQRWDTGWDFMESTSYHINRFDRDYIFDHYRRDALGTWGNSRSYMSRLLSRRFFHFTNVFRFYLFQRRTAFAAPLFDDWAEAAYQGVNALERVLQEPEPGTYCLNSESNKYEPWSGQGACAEEFKTGLGLGGGRYLNTSWTNEYFYKPNRLGFFYDKWAALIALTSSSGFFVRDFSGFFDRRAYSLGYLRVYLDPMMQRFAALIAGDHTGYRPHVVQDEGSDEKYVRYTPFFDEELADGSSVRQWLAPFPEIEPAWSWSLQYYALYYALGNWSSTADYSPEFFSFSRIAIRGTPEDVTFPAGRPVQEFTDPTTLITYRAPIIEPFTEGGLIQEFPAYYGDRFHRTRGEFRNWSVGANLLKDAADFVTAQWTPSFEGCENGTLVGPINEGNRWETQEDACAFHERAGSVLYEKVGFIDRVRKFNRRAEYSFDYRR